MNLWESSEDCQSFGKANQEMEMEYRIKYGNKICNYHCKKISDWGERWELEFACWLPYYSINCRNRILLQITKHWFMLKTLNKMKFITHKIYTVAQKLTYYLERNTREFVTKIKRQTRKLPIIALWVNIGVEVIANVVQQEKANETLELERRTLNNFIFRYNNDYKQ